jgi:iron complex outermembrane receptor protein
MPKSRRHPDALITPFVLIAVLGFLSVPAGAAAADKTKPRGQEIKKETGPGEQAQKVEITVTAPRVEIPLKANPAATSVVTTQVLEAMPRTIAIDEALKLVPGVKVDNQADGERVHLSIRGQGILTERGTRGIKALVDGIPLNDPSGFVPDFFDVDWTTVNRIEILRGPAAAFYGSGSSGGILNILTLDGGPAPIAANAYLSGGSFGFYKGQAGVGGTTGPLNYRISGSYASSDGYRDHTDFWADNFSGKFHIDASPSIKLTAVLSYTDFYNGNAEGLNLAWFSADPSQYRKLANPDAYSLEEYKKTPAWYQEMFGLDRVPGNEYQQTGRLTGGITGAIKLAESLNLAATSFYRRTNYTESVPSSVIHRTYDTPGFSLQLNHDAGGGGLKNHLSVGADLGWQSIDETRHPNLGNAVEGSGFLADQNMSQSAAGVFLLDRIEIGPEWGVMFSLRYDKVTCKLADRLGSLSGDASYKKTTGRLGLTWNPLPDFGLYASWGTGFLPPGTEELANNPNAFGGFNSDLKPATSSGEEIGLRGSLGPALVYDLAVFHLATDDDFGRFRMSSRPLETFYGNVGSTRRYGLETSLAWYPLDPVVIRLAYTYSHFKYDEVRTLDSAGSSSGTWLPNSPEHQLFLDGEVKVVPALRAGASLEVVSSWYLDSTNRVFAFDPVLYPGVMYGKTDPYALVHVRIGYGFEIAGAPWEIVLSGRNILGVEYYGFTEPDPDGNSYQPAATAEWTIGLRLGLGRTK